MKTGSTLLLTRVFLSTLLLAGALAVPAPFHGGTNCFYRLQLP